MHKDCLYQPLRVVEGMTDAGQSERESRGIRLASGNRSFSCIVHVYVYIIVRIACFHHRTILIQPWPVVICAVVDISFSTYVTTGWGLELSAYLFE